MSALLELRQITKAFGGLLAVTSMDLHVGEGEIVSVIGPNGAGKTTLFNLISGIYRPDSGQIVYRGRSIVGLRPDEIMRRGIARTFQTLRLFANLSVLDNVLASQHHRLRSSLPAAILRTPAYRRAERRMREEAVERIAFFGDRLGGYLLELPVNSLSYANRRRVEMARAMAGGAELLLLDEPAAGMDPMETVEITTLIKEMRDRLGYTILLVEHKMGVVGEISDRVVVLDYGQKIAEGTYAEVVDNPRVIEAYLGRQSRKQAEAADGDAK